ncbi:MAG: c-type cytochrome [Gammaproteobacteria bacterium]
MCLLPKLIAGCCLVATVPALAAIYDDPENLRVLPADITSEELRSTMKEFALGLGVRCEHCHVGEGDDLTSFEFELDKKKPKRIARKMLELTASINRNLASIDVTGETQVSVSCVTCHRGLPAPLLIEDVLARTLEEGGPHAAVTRYRALRQEYFGSHSYDFSELTLSMYAEGLTQAGATDSAIALLELNREYYPASALIEFYLGRAYESDGNSERALEAYRTAIDKDPGLAEFLQPRIDNLETAGSR